MNRVVAFLYSLEHQEPLGGLVVHFLDCSSTDLPDEVRDPASWNGLQRQGWPGIVRQRLGSAVTDRKGIAELRYPPPAVDGDGSVNLWAVVTGAVPAADGLSNVVCIASELRRSAGPIEHYRLSVPTARLLPVASRSVAGHPLAAGAGTLLTRLAQSLPTDLVDAPEPEEVTHFLGGFADAREDEARDRPRSFPMRLDWEFNGAGVRIDHALGGLVLDDGAGGAIALHFDGVRRSRFHQRSRAVLQVAATGGVRVSLPSLPQRLALDESEATPLREAAGGDDATS
jgi:hypothetical protein